MRLKGVSRTHRISGRRSLSVTSAAREISALASPCAIAARVPIEHGSTIIPFVGWLPLAIAAPMSASDSCTVFLGAAPSSFSTRSLRPPSPSSSASTRNEFSEATKCTRFTRSSASSARNNSRPKTAPDAPVRATVRFMTSTALTPLCKSKRASFLGLLIVRLCLLLWFAYWRNDVFQPHVVKEVTVLFHIVHIVDYQHA